MPARIISTIFIILFYAVSAHSWEYCFNEAGATYNINSNILKSIATVESRKSPYVINIDGRGKFYANKQEALTELRQLNINNSFDIGIMQINTFWFRIHNIPPEMGYNPCFNIHLGAYILAYELYRADGDLNIAIGRYHSPNLTRGKQYREKVNSIYSQKVN
jgi:soluble lytic murein transglycosylase-like protein